MPRSSPPPPVAQPATELAELPVEQVHPSADNPREDLGDLSELADSIRRHGLLEPLVVAPRTSGDGYDLVVGHRRYAAARSLALKTVPALIRPDLIDLPAMEARLMENLQRRDLSPIEEARAFQTLILAGRRQIDVAHAVGRNQGHISKRLSLLRLPDAAQKAVDEGRIPVAEAVDLAKLPEPLIHDVLFAVERGTDVGTALRRVQVKASREEDKAAAVMTLQIDGVRILDGQPAYDSTHGPYPLSFMPWVDATTHPTGPCHAAVISNSPRADDTAGAVGRWVTLVCTEPDNHPAQDGVEDPEDAARRSSAELAAARTAEHQRAQAAATAARRAFIAGLIGPRKRFGKAQAQDHLERVAVLQTLTETAYSPSSTSLALAASWVAPDSSDARAELLAEIGRLSGEALVRWALACRLALDELAMTHEDGYAHVEVPGPLAAEHLAYLERVGYVLSDVDQQLVDADGFPATKTARELVVTC